MRKKDEEFKDESGPRLKLPVILGAGLVLAAVLVLTPMIFIGPGKKENALPPAEPEHAPSASTYTEAPPVPGTEESRPAAVRDEQPEEPSVPKRAAAVTEAPGPSEEPQETPELQITAPVPPEAQALPPAPKIIFTSPENDSFYRSKTRFTGDILDRTGSPFDSSELKSVSLTATNTGSRRQIIPDEDGSFAFDLSTEGSRSDIIVEVTAETIDSRTSRAQMRLRNDRQGPLLEAAVRPVKAQADPEQQDTAASASGPHTDYLIEGRVADASYASDTIGEVKTLTLREVGQAGDSAAVEYDGMGRFIFAVPPSDGALSDAGSGESYSGNRIFELVAADYHHNRTRLILEVPAAAATEIAADSLSFTPEFIEPAPARESSPVSVPVSLIVATPLQNSVYRSSVHIAGTLKTDTDPRGLEIQWELSGTERKGTLPVNAEGGFEARLDTRGLTDTQLLHLEAVPAGSLMDTQGASDRTISPRQSIAGEPIKIILRDDGAPPSVTIDSPKDGSFYEAVVTVSGRITDQPDLRRGAEQASGDGSKEQSVSSQAADRPGAPAPGAGTDTTGEIESAGWLIEGTSEAGPLKLNEDGSFQFRFSAIDLPDRVSLVVWAEDYNLHRGEAHTILLNDGIGPHIVVHSPAQQSYYAESVRISGTIWNDAGSSGRTDDVRSLSYVIEDQEEEPRFIFFEEDGSYLIDVDTRDCSGPVSLKISAEDTLGNREEKVLALRDGTLEPELTIQSPADGDSYGLSFYLRGRVEDPYARDREYGGIELVEYQIDSIEYREGQEALQGSLLPEKDGSFAFQIDAADLTGIQRVTVNAVARNGNSSTRSFNIKPGDVSIPGISIAPGDGFVEIDWEEMPFTSGYTVHLSRTGDTADEESADSIQVRTPPVRVGDLLNGRRYSFRVETSVRSRRIISATYEAIPMEASMLEPRIRPDYQRLDISWQPLPGSEQYDVLRSLSPEGTEWEVIAEDLESASYTDYSVSYGRKYFYAVRPSGGIGLTSTIASASPLPAPVSKFETVAENNSFHKGKIEIVGGYAFFAAREGGIRIVDITLPGSLDPIGTAATEGAADITVSGDYAYIGEGERGYKIFNISDPRSLYEVARKKTVNAEAVAADGEYLFIADGPAGLKVIDVRDPLYPSEVYRASTGYARDCSLGNGTLFLLTENGLSIYSRDENAAEASINIRQLGSLELDDPISLCIDGNYAYVIERGRGLAVVNIADQAAPSLTARLPLPSADTVEVYRDFAYISSTEGGFWVVDVYNPAVPMIFERSRGGLIDDMALSGSTLISCGEEGLRRISTYLFGKSYNTGSYKLNATAHHINLQDGFIQVAQRASGLASIPFRRGGAPSSAPLSVLPGYAESSTRWQGYTIVAAGDEGLKFYSGLQPAAAPDRTLPTGGKAREIEISGDTAAVSTDGNVIIYTLDGKNFFRIASIPSADPRSISLTSDRLVIADYHEGIRLMDLSSPQNPKQISVIDHTGCRSMALLGNTIFAGGFEGISVFDISNPFSPRRTAFLHYPFVETLRTDGTYLYVAQGVLGVKVIDPFTERGPRLVSSCEEIYAVDLAVRDGLALVSSGTEVKIVEVVIPPWLQSSQAR